MGSDQSQPVNPGQGATTSFTTGDLSSFSASFRDRDGALSPRQDSVCSDSEVPYVSYTVSKPIGDSPKKGKPPSSSTRYRFTSPRLSQRSASTTSATSYSKQFSHFKSSHNTLVVVNKPGRGDVNPHQDSELARLARIPTFLPVMRASLSVSASKGSSVAKDPDILEKLDPRGLLAICQRYQSHLKHCAGVVSTDQAEICKRVRETDEATSKVTSSLVERQKVYAKHSEKLKTGVKDISKVLAKCHMLLNENLEQLEILNNMLPKEDRLEPFVWTTG
jgi:hypothetical protein